MQKITKIVGLSFEGGGGEIFLKTQISPSIFEREIRNFSGP